MHAWALDPALAQLLQFQGVAKLKRLARGFSTPRRAALSSLALLLASIWLGNAALSIVYRDAYNQASFHYWLPVVPLIYATWQLLKAAWHRPDEPLEWTPAERDLLCGGPFNRRSLIVYRIAVILTATLLKATCATLLLLPDLVVSWAGFVAIFLGLAFVDLLRMCIDITAGGVSARTYRRLRAGVLASSAAFLLGGLGFALARPEGGAATTGFAASLAWLMQYLRGLGDVLQTPIGSVLLAPFQVYAHVIAASSVTPSLFGWLALGAGMVAAVARLAVWLDARLYVHGLEAERRSYVSEGRGEEAATDACTRKVDMDSVPQWLGIGPLVWRQLLGVRMHFGGLLLALTAPAILSGLPLMQRLSPVTTFGSVAAALAFYSLLLLPAGLKFDFRRDVERLEIFKTLPIGSTSIVLGQLAAPVLVATVFQLLVLIAAAVLRPVPAAYVAGAIAFLFPMNLLIFSMENAIFLLYPYRPNQEGLEVFLRTTLTFTAKSLLFALALVVVYWLSQLARDVSQLPFVEPFLGGNHRAAFAVTMWCAVTLASVFFTLFLARIYDQHDPSLDRIA
jgi:hypothetical protein